MTIHPDLLKACAAYLAHADTYYVDEAGALALLRPDARVSNSRVDEVRAVEMPMAEASVDVDKLSDLELVRRILAEGGSADDGAVSSAGETERE